MARRLHEAAVVHVPPDPPIPRSVATSSVVGTALHEVVGLAHVEVVQHHVGGELDDERREPTINRHTITGGAAELTRGLTPSRTGTATFVTGHVVGGRIARRTTTHGAAGEIGRVGSSVMHSPVGEAAACRAPAAPRTP